MHRWMDNDFIERSVFSLSFRYHYHVGFRGDSPRRKAWEVEARQPRDLFLSRVFSSRRYYAPYFSFISSPLIVVLSFALQSRANFSIKDSAIGIFELMDVWRGFRGESRRMENRFVLLLVPLLLLKCAITLGIRFSDQQRSPFSDKDFEECPKIFLEDFLVVGFRLIKIAVENFLKISRNTLHDCFYFISLLLILEVDRYR